MDGGCESGAEIRHVPDDCGTAHAVLQSGGDACHNRGTHHGTVGEKCATNKTDESCHIATIVISPSTTPGTRSAVLFNHYSLLRTAEQLLGLPLLGKAASYPSMAAAFRL